MVPFSTFRKVDSRKTKTPENCQITLEKEGFQPVKFALYRPTSGLKLKNLSHLKKARKLSVFSIELPGLSIEVLKIKQTCR